MIAVRPVKRGEVVEYLRVLPAVRGLPDWEPAPAAWYGGDGAGPPPPPPLSDADLEAMVEEVMGEGFRPQAAFVDGRVVGASAMLSLEMTVPGPRTVAMGGVTSTGVLATHRRQGLLRRMMHAMLVDAHDRGEPLAALSASEGGIYGRFGFSPATMRVRWELERSDAAFLAPVEDDGRLELVEADVARRAWPPLHDAVRRGRVGEVSASSGRWEGLGREASGREGPLQFVVHRDPGGGVDGIANFRLPWSADPARAGTLRVEALEAASATAYAALWRLLSDFDLTGRVVAAGRPVDEPLRWMLTDPRALRVTRQSDNLWLRVVDLAAALRARSYPTSASLVFRVADDAMCPWNNGVWQLDATAGEPASLRRVDAEPSCSLSINAVGSLYLGGVSPAVLRFAGRIDEHRAGALDILASLFVTDPQPFNAVGF